MFIDRRPHTVLSLVLNNHNFFAFSIQTAHLVFVAKSSRFRKNGRLIIISFQNKHIGAEIIPKLSLKIRLSIIFSKYLDWNYWRFRYWTLDSSHTSYSTFRRSWFDLCIFCVVSWKHEWTKLHSRPKTI